MLRASLLRPGGLAVALSLWSRPAQAVDSPSNTLQQSADTLLAQQRTEQLQEAQRAVRSQDSDDDMPLTALVAKR